MFTGIVQKSSIESISKNQVCIKKPKFKIKLGDSININGICSTVEKITKNYFCVSYMEETLKLTTAKNWKIKDDINIEKSLTLNDLVGGHLVSGHIDCTGIIKNITKNQNSLILKIDYPKIYKKYIIKKGSISINGVSLTIIDDLSVSLVEHTIKNTNLKNLKKGSRVNLEFDLIAKYLAKLNA
ncbi:MAG: riboflavin synthase [Patescibacteria group bacterium]